MLSYVAFDLFALNTPRTLTLSFAVFRQTIKIFSDL